MQCEPLSCMEAAQEFHQQLEAQRGCLSPSQLKKQRKKRARLFKQAAMGDDSELHAFKRNRPAEEPEVSVSTQLPAASGIAQTVADGADSRACVKGSKQQHHQGHQQPFMRPSFRCVGRRVPSSQPTCSRQSHDLSDVLRVLQQRPQQVLEHEQSLQEQRQQQQQQQFVGLPLSTSKTGLAEAAQTSVMAGAEGRAAVDSSGSEAATAVLAAAAALASGPDSSTVSLKGPCRSDLSGQLAVINQQLSNVQNSSSSMQMPGSENESVLCQAVQQQEMPLMTQQQQLRPQQQQEAQQAAAVRSRKSQRQDCRYGNYHHYYGYRLGPGEFEDPRLKVLDPAWFKGADVLDVGCNEGLVTLALAVGCGCRSVTGVDIDGVLVAKACKNLSRSRTQLTQQYKETAAAAAAGRDAFQAALQAKAVPLPSPLAAIAEADAAGQPAQAVKNVTPLSVIKASSAILGSSAFSSGGSSSTANNTSKEPVITASAAGSLAGSVAGSPVCKQQQQQQQQQQQGEELPALDASGAAVQQNCKSTAEPNQLQQQQQQQQSRRSLQAQLVQLERQLKGLSRVSFKAGDWLQMKCASNKYEVITCFSVTKWIHLNWGDDGVMKLFHKFYRCLAPNGILVLEPQPSKSYKNAAHKPGVQEAPFHKLDQLKLRPDAFCEFLTQRVGFELVQQLHAVSDATGSQAVPVKGFDRPILVLRKPSAVNFSVNLLN